MFSKKSKRGPVNFSSLSQVEKRAIESKVTNPQAAVEMMGQAPINAYTKARIAFFEIFADPVIDKNRFFVIIVALLAVVVGLMVLLNVLLPLKKTEPFIIRIDQNGVPAASADGAVALRNFKPGEAEIRYFVKNWVFSMGRIDKYLVKQDRADAYNFTRENAQEEFRDWLKTDRPFEKIASDPGYSRTLSFRTVTIAKDGLALVRVQFTDRTGAGKTTVKNKLVTIHFATVPSTDPDKLLENPLGFYVTHFEIQDEML